MDGTPLFVSWSGTRSHAVALALRDWLPQMMQELEPFVSSEDIARGKLWTPELRNAMDRSTFAIVVVTPENREAPFLLFEVGGLLMSHADSVVAPLLVDLSPADVDLPLSQLQATVAADELGVRKLLEQLNAGLQRPLTADVFSKAFDRLWPELAEKITQAKRLPTSASKGREDSEKLDDLLTLVADLVGRPIPSTSLNEEEVFTLLGAITGATISHTAGANSYVISAPAEALSETARRAISVIERLTGVAIFHAWVK